MSRSEQREKAVLSLYAYLSLPRDIHSIMEDSFGSLDKADPYFIRVVENAQEHIQEYKNYR